MHDMTLIGKMIGSPKPYNPKKPGDGVDRRMALWLRWARVIALECPDSGCKAWLTCLRPPLQCRRAWEGDRWDWDWGWRGSKRTEKYGVKDDDWSRVSRGGTEDLIECERIAQRSGWKPDFVRYFGLPGPYLYIDHGFEQGKDGEVRVAIVRPLVHEPPPYQDWFGRRMALFLRFARANGEICPDKTCRREGICQRKPLACRLKERAKCFDWNQGWHRRIERQRRELLAAGEALPEGVEVSDAPLTPGS